MSGQYEHGVTFMTDSHPGLHLQVEFFFLCGPTGKQCSIHLPSLQWNQMCMGSEVWGGIVWSVFVHDLIDGSQVPSLWDQFISNWNCMTSEVASVHQEQTLWSQFHSNSKCWCVMFMLMLSAYVWSFPLSHEQCWSQISFTYVFCAVPLYLVSHPPHYHTWH